MLEEVKEEEQEEEEILFCQTHKHNQTDKSEGDGSLLLLYV